MEKDNITSPGSNRTWALLVIQSIKQVYDYHVVCVTGYLGEYTRVKVYAEGIVIHLDIVGLPFIGTL